MKQLPLITAVALATIFSAYFLWFDIGRHNKTNSTRFDLGNVEQVEWNLIHGRGFTMTDPYGTETVSRFVFHADPFLLVLAPAYALFPRTETLLLLQVLAVASGGLALFLIGRKMLHAWWGVLLTFLYVINPALQWATIFDVHAVTFAVPLILWAAWAVVSKKYWVTFVFVVLAMLTKEQIGLSLPLIGLFVWWKHRNAKWGIVLTVLPVLWSLLMFLTVLPIHQSTNDANNEVYSSVFGSGASDVIAGAVQHPATFVRQLTSSQNLTMLWQLLGPLGFLPLGALYSLGALPDYIINALSLKPAQHLIISHYSAGMTPWLFIGVVITIVWLLKLLHRVKLRSILHNSLFFILVFWLIGWAGYSAWAFGPLPGAKNDHSRFVIWRNVYAEPVRQWSSRIPSMAAVSVTNNIGAHFARRENLYSFPLGVEQADYIVVLEGHAIPVVATQAEVTEAIFQLRHDPEWRVLERQGDLTVLKRKE